MYKVLFGCSNNQYKNEKNPIPNLPIESSGIYESIEFTGNSNIDCSGSAKILKEAILIRELAIFLLILVHATDSSF
jgi:hypothetical protein